MSNKLPALNLPQCKLSVKTDNGVHYILDKLRKEWLVITPEEWVRQNFIGYLINNLGVIPQYIVQEYNIDLGGIQRADIVVFAPDGKALLLVECKASEVSLDKDVLAQAVRYNSVVGAPYIVLTNGIKHFCFNGKATEQLTGFPDLSPFFGVQ